MPFKPGNYKKYLQGEAKSNSSSAPGSRARTPQLDGEDSNPLDVSFGNLEELLMSKLDSLQDVFDYKRHDDTPQGAESLADNRQKVASELSKARIHAELTSINDILYSLSRPRTEVSSQSREMLLAQLYKLLVSKPLIVYNEENFGTRRYVSEEKAEELLRHLMHGEYRSSSEFILLFRSCIAMLASDIEEFGYLITEEFLGHVRALITDNANSFVTTENKANVVTGYACILLILHSGSSSYGIDNVVMWLMELAEAYNLSSNALSEQVKTGDREYSTFLDENDDKRILNDTLKKSEDEAGVTVAALHGAACLVTLLDRGEYLNEFIKDMMMKLSEIIDNDNIEIAKAAGRATALCYEIYSYNEDEDANDQDDEYNDNAPYYEQEELLAILDRLANLSSHKISRKSKHETHSIFRDVLNTVKAYTDQNSRTEILKRSPEGLDILNTTTSYSHIKLSRKRSLTINSWFLYLRLIHLKWCFGFGVQNQLLSNENVRDVLKEPLTDYQLKYGVEDSLNGEGDYDESFQSTRSNRRATDEKKKTEAIRKARVNKLSEEMDELELKED